MRDLIGWLGARARSVWARSPRTIALDGLAPFPFETHGSRDAHVSASIEWQGVWEQATTALLLELLRGAADVIDVGANIGWHSIVAGHRLGTRGRVHAFEPEPENLARLRRNVVLNGLDNVVVNGWALSDSGRRDTLSLSPNNLGDHRLGLARGGRRSIDVEVRRLDDYDGVGDRPLVIKLDAQGSEWHALHGGQQLLRSHPHEIVLLCEICPLMLEECGASLEALIGLLVENGFAAAIIDQKTGRLMPAGWERLKDRLESRRQDDPECNEDIVAFRRPDGLMRGIFSQSSGVGAME